VVVAHLRIRYRLDFAGSDRLRPLIDRIEPMPASGSTAHPGVPPL
jgi:hypothetical protein